MGVPEPVARNFIPGHINIPLAIVFSEFDWDSSAGAKRAIADAKPEILQPDWRERAFNMDAVTRSIARITGDQDQQG